MTSIRRARDHPPARAHDHGCRRRRFRCGEPARVSGDRPRPGGRHQDRAPHAAHWVPGAARRIRHDGRQHGRGRSQRRRRARSSGRADHRGQRQPRRRDPEGAEADRGGQGGLPDRRDQLRLGARDRRASRTARRSSISIPAPTPMRCAAATATAYMFHVEGCNTMYTKTIGLWQQRQGLIDGAKWYFLTADYAFGHDLYRVSSKFLRGERRDHPRQRHGADQHPRLQRLHPEDPSGGPGLRLPQPRGRRPDHLPQAVQRVRA